MNLQAPQLSNTSRSTELHDDWHRVTWPGWISRDPKHLKEEEKHALSLIHTSLPLDRAYELPQQFVAMFKERNAQQLASWLRACQLSEISDLVTFAQSLELEGSVLQAALTLPWSNGPVEGKINKLKYIKRSMYGRSGFSLLRQKVLKAG